METVTLQKNDSSIQEEYLTDKFLEEVELVGETSDPHILMNVLQQIDWDFNDLDTSSFNHDLHPYPAKYIPQIPQHLISKLSLRGEVILDPFGGSGTTALEAVRLGRTAISLDANPVSTTIGKAKTTYIHPEEIEGLKHLIFVVNNHYDEIIKGRVKHEDLYEQHRDYIPAIPNMEKWFTSIAVSELALLKNLIETLSLKKAKDIALTAFLKVVMKVCNQESETRYSSVQKNIKIGHALKSYCTELSKMINKVLESMEGIQNAVVDFRDADARVWETWNIEPESISLIVTSPPYPNAYDYHLYHRFRIFWLGKNPGELRKVEIGSHLRHQSKKDGFDAYLDEMTFSLKNMYTALQPGRYAVLVVGNGIYKGVEYETGKALLKVGEELGFEPVGRIERNLPKTRRSVTSTGRRLQKEDIIILRKPNKKVNVTLLGPYYKLLPYEKGLQYKEIESMKNVDVINHKNREIKITCSSEKLSDLRKLAFVDSFKLENTTAVQKTWQSHLESNGTDEPKNRKEPKYVTHGIHAYKGKFYPQLAKSLINISNFKPGSKILDPFMGSGTVLLESYLNGYRGIGMDMNPMAVHIAKAKLGILKEKPEFIQQSISYVIRQLRKNTNFGIDVFSEFPEPCHSEIKNWFPRPVIEKLNFLLRAIRLAGSTNIKTFLEVCVSDIIREISHQDPKDLRIRKRQVLLEDAPVFEMFIEKVEKQLERLKSYWEVTPFCPTQLYNHELKLGDNRNFNSFLELGLEDNSIDLVVTSPPYFTALPYIDTDRLSLLTILGIPRKENMIIEREITGSREITKAQKLNIEKTIEELELPNSVKHLIKTIQEALSIDEEAGFRRQNTPALLARYFSDMDKVFKNLYRLLKKDGLAWIVIGNNKTKINNEEYLIDSVSLLKDIAIANGFRLHDEIDITVTRENLRHIRNSITENGVLGFRK
jgi:DNA modification methylase